MAKFGTKSRKCSIRLPEDVVQFAEFISDEGLAVGITSAVRSDERYRRFSDSGGWDVFSCPAVPIEKEMLSVAEYPIGPAAFQTMRDLVSLRLSGGGKEEVIVSVGDEPDRVIADSDSDDFDVDSFDSEIIVE